MSTTLYTSTLNLVVDRRVYEAKCSYDKIQLRVQSERFKKLCAKVARIKSDAKQQKYKTEKFSVFQPSLYLEENKKYHSGVIQIDIDGMDPAEQEKLRSRLEKDCKHLLLALSSIRKGLRLFVRTNLQDVPVNDHVRKLHKLAYTEVLNNLEISGLKDNCGNQLSRLCFFSYDKNCFYNRDAEALELDLERLEAVIEEQEKLAEYTLSDDLNNEEALRAFQCINPFLPYEKRFVVVK